VGLCGVRRANPATLVFAARLLDLTLGPHETLRQSQEGGL
jgi:hypothetical protein